MIAVFGIPGSVHHRYYRVATHKEGAAWLEYRRRIFAEEHPAAIGQPEAILTEHEAARRRYADGTRVYPK